MLSGQAIDLVLACAGRKAVPSTRRRATGRGSGSDIPLLALFDDVDATGSAPRSPPARARSPCATTPSSCTVIRRGIRTSTPAGHSAGWRPGSATERRCDALIDRRDPIAYVHEGMHIRANGRTWRCSASIPSTTSRACRCWTWSRRATSPTSSSCWKAVKGRPPPGSHELQARGPTAQEFPAVMEFTQARGRALRAGGVPQAGTARPGTRAEAGGTAERDPVTGLLNRRPSCALEDAVGDAGGKARHGLPLVEPDHYQRLLHDMGLDAADAVLAAMAGGSSLRCRAATRSRRASASTALVVLLNGGDHQHAGAGRAHPRRLRRTASSEIGEHSSVITASIGGVQIGEKNANVSQVLAKANQGVQSALAGGNRFEIFDPSATDRAEEERIQAWVADLRMRWTRTSSSRITAR